MIDIFFFKLMISFFVGVIWITIVTFISEKLGTKLGAAIASIPSTMVISLFFIGWTQSPIIASKSTALIPFMLGINSLFVVIYILLSKFKLIISLTFSLLIWFLLTYLLINANFNYYVSVVGFIICVTVSYFVLEKILKIKSQGKKISKKTVKEIVFRSLISGSVIFFAVFMAKTSGPIAGGVFASFPAMTVALIIILQLSHGHQYTSAFLKNFIISGTINVFIYVAFIRYFYLYFGLFVGTGLSFLISLISTYLTYNIINKKMS